MIYKLLTEEQVLGNEKTEVISTIGAVCNATDFAIITGAELNEERACKWFLSSAAGYGDVIVIKQDGERGIAYSNTTGSIRPIMECPDINELECVITKDISGFNEVQFGEYPCDAVSRSLASELEQEFIKKRLVKTGKKYNGVYEEFQYEDKKYVRAEYLSKREHVLSNEKKYKSGDYVWLEVAPVKWLHDEKAGHLISKNVIVSGIQFSSENYYAGHYEKTSIFLYMDNTLPKDLTPSAFRELEGEELAQYEEDVRMAAKRNNPYGMKFGDVTEEDIIRGAIESDIPVFLHGQSSEGKSARVKQIDPTCELIYLRNATPDSLNGRSVYNQETGDMIDIPPTWYKKLKEKCEREPDKLHVVFFDEINNALPSIQGMAFNIVLDREVNGIWRLPENARVVAAGNDMQDSLAAHQIAAPFFNRFAHVYINTTTEKWLSWARKYKIHPAIYSFIAYKRGETLRSPYDGVKPNADPRKWEMASKMLYATGQPEMLRALIGEDITDEFVKFCNQPVIPLEDVLNGDYTDRELENMNTAEKYATTIGLSQVEKEHLHVVREFVAKLGEEFRAVLDSFISPEDK